MSLTLSSITSNSVAQQSFFRDVNSTIQRLNAGVTVRPQDDPAAFASFQQARETENRLRTASLNAQRAQAFGSAALDQLNVADQSLQELRDIFAGNNNSADAQNRIDELLNTLSRAQDAEFNGNALFNTTSARPVGAIDETSDPTPVATSNPDGVQGESLRVNIAQTSRDQSTRVDFSGPIEDAVVIANVSSFNETDPATARVVGIDENGVNLQLQEFDSSDGVNAGETVDVLALQAGSFTLDSGQRLEVGRAAVSGSDTRIEFNQTFDAAPIILTTIQSANDPTAVVVRQVQANRNGFTLLLQQEEALGRTFNGEEIVGFIAIEAGSGDFGGLSFVAGQTPDNVTDEQQTIGFGQALENPSFFASLASTDGGDTANTRVTNVTSTGATVFVEEETSRDAETRHTTERVSFFALDGTGRLNTPEPPEENSTPIASSEPNATFALTPELALNTNGFGLNSIAPDSLGDENNSLADLATGGELSLSSGNRSRALATIDAALDQVGSATAQTQTFVRITVGSVERVNQSSLAATESFRQTLENRAGQQAAEDARRLLLRSAGQSLVNQARQDQADTVLSLLESAGGTRLTRPRGTQVQQNVQDTLIGQLAEALTNYTLVAGLASRETPEGALGSAPGAGEADEAPGGLPSAGIGGGLDLVA